MSGTIPVSGLKREVALSDIIYDPSGLTADFVAGGLKLDREEMRRGYAFAIEADGKIAGGVVFTELRPGISSWISIYTVNKRWCSARSLRRIFSAGFDLLGCRRLNALVSAGNPASLSLAKRCGFVTEGKMRRYGGDGQDVYVLGMLREECKFINNLRRKENVKRI